MYKKSCLFAAAPVAAFLLLLAGCENQPQEVTSQAPDPLADQLSKAKPVTLPPAIREARTYRCKNNSLVYVTYMTDNVTAAVRDKQEEPPVAVLKAPAPGEPFVSEGYSLRVSGNTISYNSPDKGTQSCKF
jgi:hypothetical protein